MKCPPEAYADSGETVMSNFDSVIDRDIEKRLRTEKIMATYTGLDFCGTVWFEDGEFCCGVMVHHTHRETVSRPTLSEIMIYVCEHYGRE